MLWGNWSFDMNNFINKYIFSTNFFFAVVLVYISFINFFVLKSSPEIIFLQFAVMILMFRRFRMKSFFKTWILFIGAFVFYEFLRGFADDLSPFYNTTLFAVYNLEKTIFGILPTIYLQQLIPAGSWITHIGVFFYTTFFYYSFLVAFIIWLKDPKKFSSYFFKFILLTYIGLAIFFLVPTAPPWLVSQKLGLEVVRYLLKDSILGSFSYLRIYAYFVQGNEVAALPSLHVAWPLFSTVFLVKNYRNKWLYVLFIVPGAIAFSIVLTGEHYVIDVLASVILVFLLFVPKNYARIYKKIKVR